MEATHWRDMAMKRTKAMNVRMLPGEYTMLCELAEHEGISVSEWIRNQVRREHALTFAAPQRKKKAK